MTIDRSLRVRKGMLSNRNVLKRAERLEKLKETERWKEGDSIFGLPKVKIEKVALKRKKKVKKLEDTDEAGTEATPGETET
jgi:small basic protein (TIGR04137 family)